MPKKSNARNSIFLVLANIKKESATNEQPNHVEKESRNVAKIQTSIKKEKKMIVQILNAIAELIAENPIEISIGAVAVGLSMRKKRTPEEKEEAKIKASQNKTNKYLEKAKKQAQKTEKLKEAKNNAKCNEKGV